MQVEGRRRIISTNTSDASLAKVRAKNLIERALDGKWDEDDAEKKAYQGIPTFGECVDQLLTGDQHVRRATANDYVSSLFKILEEVKGWDREESKTKKIDILTDTVVRDFQAKRQNRDTVTFVEPLKVNTTINSTVRQARSVFSQRAITNYEAAGMTMPPTLQKFLKAPALKQVSHKYSDNPIPQDQIDSMNEALPALREQDERLWAVHIMIRLMGMRDSEMWRARKDWIVKRGEKAFLVINSRDGEAAPKRSDGEIPIPQVLLEWFALQPGEFLIPGKHKTERYNVIYRQHNKFVREHVVNRTKGNHELRKWAGSIVAQKTNSWERAADFLRIDIETAKSHYLAFTEPTEALGIEDL